MVVSRWELIHDWIRWRQSKQEFEIVQKIELLIGEKAEYNIYALMVTDSDQGASIPQKTGVTKQRLASLEPSKVR